MPLALCSGTNAMLDCGGPGMCKERKVWSVPAGPKEYLCLQLFNLQENPFSDIPFRQGEFIVPIMTANTRIISYPYFSSHKTAQCG